MASQARQTLIIAFRTLLDRWSGNIWEEGHPSAKNRIQAISEIKSIFVKNIPATDFTSQTGWLLRRIEESRQAFVPQFDTSAGSGLDIHPTVQDLLEGSKDLADFERLSRSLVRPVKRDAQVHGFERLDEGVFEVSICEGHGPIRKAIVNTWLLAQWDQQYAKLTDDAYFQDCLLQDGALEWHHGPYLSVEIIDRFVSGMLIAGDTSLKPQDC